MMIDQLCPTESMIMTPVRFNGCFGWFHQNWVVGSVRPAVLLCSGISQDFSNGYRPFRLLANHLAQLGHPVLRFDYAGIGDSAEPDGVNLWQVWQENTAQAALWLRKYSDVQDVIFIGLRIGAVLATLEASKGAAGLVLIEPCLTGRSYVSQIVTEARLRGGRQPDGGIELGELKFSRECLEEMRAATLAEIALPPGFPAAIYTHMPVEKVMARLMPWQQKNIEVFWNSLEGLEAMLRPSHHDGEAELEPSALLDWLHRRFPVTTPLPHARSLAVKYEDLVLPEYIETLLRFGDAGVLTGMLCVPAVEYCPGLIVVICNTGGNPRHGFARFGVELARALAAAGITSLRFDFAGFGDSIYYDDGCDLQSRIFMTDRGADIQAAVNTLEALGYNEFALQGLCSGAYHAVHGVCLDSRITRLLAVNLPWFSLRHERPGTESVTQFCMNKLLAHNKSALFLYGDTESGLKLFKQHFGADGSDWALSPNIRLRVLPGIDHELTASKMRRQVIDQMIDFLKNPTS
jgi:alpha-beta hydrolase superfamily lysophospholipase